MELTTRQSDFLLKGTDPSLRLRVLQDLLGRATDDPKVVAARREVGKKGWAAHILKDQDRRGHWGAFREDGRDLYLPKYIATNWRLLVLSDLGMTADDPRIRRATDLIFRYWGERGSSVFGEEGSELCITGNVVRMMVRFGRGSDPRVVRSIDWLVKTQKPDGGWHCFPSKTGTLDCWEALAAFAVLPPSDRSEKVRKAIERGAEFYLERGLLRESDGTSYPPWHRLHYPIHYYYDLLVGLDTLTALGYGRDPRLRPALDELRGKQNPDGTWNLDAVHPDLLPDDPYHPQAPMFPFLFEYPGVPSRWITFLALRVLQRAGEPSGRKGRATRREGARRSTRRPSRRRAAGTGD
jgi:Prenyltransferase and squalene oxidase repeat